MFKSPKFSLINVKMYISPEDYKKSPIPRVKIPRFLIFPKALDEIVLISGLKIPNPGIENYLSISFQSFRPQKLKFGISRKTLVF